MNIKSTLFAIVLSCCCPLMATAAVIDFEDLSLAPESFFDPDITTTWMSGDATFDHEVSFGPCCWSGFTYSNTSDTTTPGFINQYSAITGAGFGGGGNYGVAFGGGARFTFGDATTVGGAQFTNTTYAYLAMAEGDDGNSPPFVQGPFEDGDFFEITVFGLDAASERTNSFSFLLADGADVIDDWTWVDLASLGVVYGLEFEFDSSDTGPFGVNTPTYFAIDDISVSPVPIPAAAWLLGSGLLCLLGVKRKAA